MTTKIFNPIKTKTMQQVKTRFHSRTFPNLSKYMADGGMVEKLTQAELLNQNFKEAKETIVKIHKRVKLKSGNELLLLKKENGWGIAEYNPKSKKELDWFPFADKETANYWLDKVDVDKYAC
jgi:hypothetical protein